MPGNKTKLTAGVRRLIVEGTRIGLTKELCAQWCGICSASLYNWLNLAKQHREQGIKPCVWDSTQRNWEPTKNRHLSKHLELLEAMEKAESDRLAEALVGIRKAGKGDEEIVVEETVEHFPDGTVKNTKRTKKNMPDWKAYVWIAEHTRPKDFAPTSRQEISGPDGGPVQTTLVDLISKAAEAKEMEEREKMKAAKKGGDS
jgi:transposase-like protein